MNYFTADTHLGHANCIGFDNRPFASIEEHDNVIIQNTLDTLRPGDALFHIGDLAWNFEAAQRYLDILDNYGVRLVWLLGNHDHRCQLDRLIRGNEFRHVLWLRLDPEIAPAGGLWLSHYPHRSWPSSFHGSGHLYGHVHGKLNGVPDTTGLNRSIDMGVHLWDYKPVSQDTVLELIRSIPHFPQEETV